MADIIPLLANAPLALIIAFVIVIWLRSANAQRLASYIAIVWSRVCDRYFRCLGRARQAPPADDIEMASHPVEQLAAEMLLERFQDFCRQQAQDAMERRGRPVVPTPIQFADAGTQTQGQLGTSQSIGETVTNGRGLTPARIWRWAGGNSTIDWQDGGKRSELDACEDLELVWCG
ncbi:hypothetical protein HRG_008130 [Hirsutella rhossiliensis]|uniref:Uncharacterized protein n=1 Tax=Hirsutella rhossiliensis TaxID=111463 RepID=A0A9P8MT68_9HYPO|nr:uncharacterized protein HRG_08130 [Hirsutella rhossiliensis]KAH0960977.1 hypothetical protein HRG_08130 [Hirsutella rhossiliensis]